MWRSDGFKAKIKDDKRKFRDLKTSKVCANRKTAFESLRVVLDPVSVLKDTKLAYLRGWTHWFKACEYAETKVVPSVPVDNEPWDFNAIPQARVDRWVRIVAFHSSILSKFSNSLLYAIVSQAYFLHSLLPTTRSDMSLVGYH